MGLSLLSLAVLSGCERKTGGVVDPTGFEPPRPEIQVAVAPQAVQLEVGESAQLVAAIANVPAGAPGGVRWETSDPGVASVSDLGVVACKAEGAAEIAARALASERAAGLAAVTCTPAPNRRRPSPAPIPAPAPAPAPGSLFALSTSQLSFQTQAFSNNCPLRVGELRVSNTSGQRASVRLGAGNGAIELTPDQLDLQAGMWHDVIVKYNCTANASFSTQITVTASAGGASETRRVEVRGTIQ